MSSVFNVSIKSLCESTRVARLLHEQPHKTISCGVKFILDVLIGKDLWKCNPSIFRALRPIVLLALQIYGSHQPMQPGCLCSKPWDSHSWNEVTRRSCILSFWSLVLHFKPVTWNWSHLFKKTRPRFSCAHHCYSTKETVPQRPAPVKQQFLLPFSLPLETC